LEEEQLKEKKLKEIEENKENQKNEYYEYVKRGICPKCGNKSIKYRKSFLSYRVECYTCVKCNFKFSYTHNCAYY